MTEQDGPERVHVLYERARVLELAAQESEQELAEVASQVRVALANLRRAERSWAARISRPLRRSRAGHRAARPSELRDASALLESLDAHLTARSLPSPPGPE
jgi:hypothetical protein